MFSLVFRARATTVCALVGALLSPAARAADMPFFSPPVDPPVEEPVEWVSGWYLRGDVGYSNAELPRISSDFTGSLGRIDTASGGFGVGYQFNNWLRGDVTVDRSVFQLGGASQTSVWCPYTPIGLYTSVGGTSTPVGILANPADTCTVWDSGNLNRTSVLANAYLDLGNWWGFTPYVGAGVGTSLFKANAALTYYKNSDGSIWTPDLSLPSGQVPLWITATGATWGTQLPFAKTNPNHGLEKKVWKFAWNLMAGVSYDVARNLKVDVGYRFLNAGAFTSLVGWNGQAPVTKDLISQEIRVGVRMTTD